MRLLSIAVLLWAASFWPAFADDDLPALNADIAQTSVSGISSGAFMAVQFGTAWSSTVRGVGVIAGGPYFCAQASSADVLDGYILPILTATGPCMTGPPPAPATLTATADRLAQDGRIDDLANVARQKIYLFHGTKDPVVARSVTDDAAAFYAHYHVVAPGNLFYQNTVAAGHGQITLDAHAEDGLNPCGVTQPPYINACGYDQAGILLQHIYGALNPRNTGARTGTMIAFPQARATQPFTPDAMGLSETGYVYVPADCARGASCRVHIALHGCKQDAEEIDRLYINFAGYNEWADTNGLIILYPQTEVGTGFGVAPLNPQACWDWFGYVDGDDSYVTKAGRQIGAIKAMLDALTAGAVPAALPVVASAVPAGLVVTDVSGGAAALAWRAVPGAEIYRVYRAGPDGAFGLAGSTEFGPSFGDAGLVPGTAYSWRVTAVAGGLEGAPSASAVVPKRAWP